MTFDPTKPVQTRDGRKARIICTDANDPPHTIIALVADPEDGIESIETYTKDGLYWERATEPESKDLINTPERQFRYVNVFSKEAAGAVIYSNSLLYETRAAAESSFGLCSPKAAILKLEFEGVKLIGVTIEDAEP